MLTAARVGGVVSETSFKFFIQFVGWTAIYCFFNLIVAAYFLAEYRRKVGGFCSSDPQHRLSSGSGKIHEARPHTFGCLKLVSSFTPRPANIYPI